MRKKNFCILLTIFCFLFFSNISKAQTKQSSSNAADPQKDFLIDYLKSFDNFINNPDKYWENGTRILLKFKNPADKKVVNFLSGKKNMKGNISPDSLVKHIKAYYPDGLGMAYSPEKIQPVGNANNFFSNTYVYKTPVEYSGIRKDGSLLSYTDEQYFYIKSKKNSKQLIQITDQTAINRKIKYFRQGLFVEPYIIATSENKVSIQEVEENGGKGYPDYGELWSPSISNSKKSLGLDMIYMVKHFVGFGIGFTKFSGDHQFDIYIREYWRFNYWHDRIMASGYLKNYETTNGPLIQKVKMTSSLAIPVFARIQIGWKHVSLSADIGYKFLFKPLYENYLTGKVIYNGALYNPTTTEVTFSNDPALGFKTYTFNNTFVSKFKESKNLKMFFMRFALNVQPTRYYNIRLSFTANNLKDYSYNESWHEFDPYALDFPYANQWKILKIWETEIGIGFNINNCLSYLGRNEPSKK